MKASRIGLALGEDSARIVMLRGERLVTAAEVRRVPGEGVGHTLAALLDGVPLGRGRRATLGVALGTHLSSVRRVRGLPQATDPELLAAVVRERRTAFFTGETAALRTTGVVPDGDGGAWAAALSAPAVEEVLAAAKTMGLRLVGVAPLAAVLPLALPGGNVRWTDGPRTLELEQDGDTWRSVRCVPTPLEGRVAPPEPPPDLLPLGPEGVRFADALGAARLLGTEPLSVGPDGRPFRRSQADRRRLVAPALVILTAALAALLSPLRDHLVAIRAEGAVATLESAPEWATGAEVYRQLARANGILGELDAFRAERRLLTPLLARLARDLPPDAVLQALDVQGDTAVLSLYAPPGSSALAAIRSGPDVAGVEVVGPRRLEMVAGREMEALALRVVLAGPSQASTPTDR